MPTDYSPSDVMDRESRPNRYYRNAVERHWDPGEVDLSQDRENFLNSPLAEMDLAEMGVEGGNEEVFDEFRTAIAMFGAGEDAVTEDLSPLAVVLEDIDDQMFLTTQLYEEAKHADFFDRYWTEVIHPIEEEMGWEQSNPRDEKWFNDAYLEVFGRNQEAMHRLLEEDTPENRARAYCHYHMTVEGILAQSGYYGLTTIFGDEETDLIPTLPGLVKGINSIRSDEGRHVGFGMHKLKQLINEEDVDPQLISDTVDELAALVVEALSTFDDDEDDDLPVGFDDLVDVPGYAEQKHGERMEQILDAAEDIPEVGDLVSVESDD